MSNTETSVQMGFNTQRERPDHADTYTFNNNQNKTWVVDSRMAPCRDSDRLLVKLAIVLRDAQQLVSDIVCCRKWCFRPKSVGDLYQGLRKQLQPRISHLISYTNGCMSNICVLLPLYTTIQPSFCFACFGSISVSNSHQLCGRKRTSQRSQRPLTSVVSPRVTWLGERVRGGETREEEMKSSKKEGGEVEMSKNRGSKIKGAHRESQSGSFTAAACS